MLAINPNGMAIKAAGLTWQWNPSIAGQKCAPLLPFCLRNEGEAKAIPAPLSASSARVYPDGYILMHIFVHEVIEDVYLRLISRYEEARPVARVVVGPSLVGHVARICIRCPSRRQPRVGYLSHGMG
jgi:hypothetical protein